MPAVPKDKKSIWIHAVSVGEVLSIQRFVQQTKQRFPGYVCYLTVGTLAGKKMAEKNIQADFISFLSYDFFPSMWAAFSRIRPHKIIIIEAEIWPNFLMIGKLKKVPMYLLNARMSKRSEKRLNIFRWFFKPLFNSFTHIYAQSVCDIVSFQRHLSIPEHKLTHLGNIKAFNVEPKKKIVEHIVGATKSDFETNKKYPVLLVGSVHPGELDIYLDLFKSLKVEHKNLKIILAPRHFHWKDELVKKIDQTRYPFFMWDQDTQDLNDERLVLHQISQTIFPSHDIMLVCTMGKLFHLYALADLFFLGGTFVPIGGHNLLEPAVWGKPSFIGPFYNNCRDVADQLHQRGALEKVASSRELQERVAWLLNHKKVRARMGNMAARWLAEQAESVRRHLESFFKNVE